RLSDYSDRWWPGHSVLARISQTPEVGTPRRILRSGITCHYRYDATSSRDKLPDRLRWLGDALACPVYPVWICGATQKFSGSWHEVFPAKLICFSLPALRHRNDLRCNRQHCI